MRKAKNTKLSSDEPSGRTTFGFTFGGRSLRLVSRVEMGKQRLHEQAAVVSECVAIGGWRPRIRGRISLRGVAPAVGACDTLGRRAQAGERRRSAAAARRDEPL